MLTFEEVVNRIHLALDIKMHNLAIEANDGCLIVDGMMVDDITAVLINEFSNTPNTLTIQFLNRISNQDSDYIIRLIRSHFLADTIFQREVDTLNAQRGEFLDAVESIRHPDFETDRETALQRLVDVVEIDLEILSPEQIIDNMIYWHFSDSENINEVRELLNAELIRTRCRLNSEDSVIDSCLDLIHLRAGRIGDEGGIMDIANIEISRYYLAAFPAVAFDLSLNNSSNAADLSGNFVDYFEVANSFIENAK